MKKSRFTEPEIFSILREIDSGIRVQDICGKHKISHATYYNWKSKYARTDVSEFNRVRQLEEENAKLKKMLSEANIENRAMKALFAKKDW